jgi:hypothetical protein
MRHSCIAALVLCARRLKAFPMWDWGRPGPVRSGLHVSNWKTAETALLDDYKAIKRVRNRSSVVEHCSAELQMFFPVALDGPRRDEEKGKVH